MRSRQKKEETYSNTTSISDLPIIFTHSEEVFLTILSFLDPESLLNFCLTCKAIKSYIFNNEKAKELLPVPSRLAHISSHPFNDAMKSLDSSDREDAFYPTFKRNRTPSFYSSLNQTTAITLLPDEILCHIFSFLNSKDLPNLILTCRFLKNFILETQTLKQQMPALSNYDSEPVTNRFSLDDYSIIAPSSNMQYIGVVNSFRNNIKILNANEKCIAQRNIPGNLGKVQGHYFSPKGKNLVIITELQHKKMGIFGKKTHFMYVWNIPEDTFKYYGNLSTISRSLEINLVQFISDNEFVFADGKTLTIYNLSNNSKHELGKLSPTSILVSPNGQRMICATNKSGEVMFDFYDLALKKLIGSKWFDRSIKFAFLDNETLYFGLKNFSSSIYSLSLENMKFGDKATFIDDGNLVFLQLKNNKLATNPYHFTNNTTKCAIKADNNYKAILTKDDQAHYCVLILDENNNLVFKWNTLNLAGSQDTLLLRFKANKLLFACNNQINFLTFPLLTYKDLKEKTETKEIEPQDSPLKFK